MRKKSLILIIIICGLLLIATTIIYGICLSLEVSNQKEVDQQIPAFVEHDEDNTIYLECMNNPFYSENTKLLVEEFLSIYQNDNIGLYYRDIKNQYSITIHETANFYGASVIKLLDATYLLRKAMNNELNLDDKIVYQSKHISDYSLGMENYQIGAEVPIRELIKYAISYSDNTAHEMLYEYIGIDNLKQYASTLGISLTIDEKEHFGYMTAEGTNKILAEAYHIISSNIEYGELLALAMDNDYYNSLNFSEIRFIHKYGHYGSAYNEIGIYNTKNPYFISILTSYGYQDYENKVRDISKQIYNIYSSNLNEKETYCKDLQNIKFSE